jgi:acyl-CoA synthetase (AMP-forming)/AMP-acid ligase II
MAGSLGTLSTIQWVHHWALNTPDAIVVEESGNQYTYHDLASQIFQCAQFFESIGVNKGMLVGIECDDRFLHLVLVLAADAVGATSISFYSPELSLENFALLQCDFAFLENAPHINVVPGRLYPLTQSLVDEMRRIPVGRLDVLDHTIDGDFPLRVIRSSGTTGQKKCMPFTMELVRRCVDFSIAFFDLERRHCNFFSPYNLNLRAAYLDVLTTIRLGKRLSFGRFDYSRLEGDHHTSLSVGNIHEFGTKNFTEENKVNVSIAIIAGKVTQPLFDILYSISTASIYDFYSSNETHWIAATQSEGTSSILPGVIVRVVNDDGEELPVGEKGLIEIQSNRMVSRYMWDEKANQKYFVNGWFRTFDYGYIPEPGKLVVLGRADGLLNIGGMKVAPLPIEDRISMLFGVSGVALIGAPDRHGVERLHVLVERKDVGKDASLDLDLFRRVEKIIEHYVLQYELFFVPFLPRTETGKIRHNELRDYFDESKKAN